MSVQYVIMIDQISIISSEKKPYTVYLSAVLYNIATSQAMSVKGSTPDISETCSDKSFQKTVTLQKDYGKTGALKTEDGTLYIGISFAF